MKKEIPTIDILVDNEGNEIQPCFVKNGYCLGNDTSYNTKVKFVGYGEWDNPSYAGIDGQVKSFKSKQWVEIEKNQ